jgi:hypothetical protein
LVDEYGNLMYACYECNLRKGNRSPPDATRQNGFRFFRPDYDVYSEHFVSNGLRVERNSNTGEFSIEDLDLNRLSLRKLRDIRERLTKCDELIAAGVLGLRRFYIDQLPAHVKRNAAATIAKAVDLALQTGNEIDDLLRQHARASLIDPDPESERRAVERADKMKNWKGLYPGSWRANRGEKQQPPKRSSKRRRSR